MQTGGSDVRSPPDSVFSRNELLSEAIAGQILLSAEGLRQRLEFGGYRTVLGQEFTRLEETMYTILFIILIQDRGIRGFPADLPLQCAKLVHPHRAAPRT